MLHVLRRKRECTMAKKSIEQLKKELEAAKKAEVKKAADEKKAAEAAKKAEEKLRAALTAIVEADKKEAERHDKVSGGITLRYARAFAEAVKGGLSEKAADAILSEFVENRVYKMRVKRAMALLDVLPTGGASVRMIDAAFEARKAGMDNDKIKAYIAEGNVAALTACKTGADDKTPAASAPKAPKAPAAPAEDIAVKVTALYTSLAARLAGDKKALEELEQLARLAGMPAIEA